MDRGFYLGIITALHVMDMHGDEVQFDELVNVCDLDHLVQVAVEEGELEFSGLAKREYAQPDVQADFAVECAYDEPCKQCIHPVCKNYAKRQNR